MVAATMSNPITVNGLYGQRARSMFGFAPAAPSYAGSATSSTSAQSVMEKTYSSIAKLTADTISSNKETTKLLSKQVSFLMNIAKKTGSGGLGIGDLLVAKYLGKFATGAAAGIAGAAAGAVGGAATVARTVGGGVKSLFTSFGGQVTKGVGTITASAATALNTTFGSIAKGVKGIASFSALAGTSSKIMSIVKMLPSIGMLTKGLSRFLWPITAVMGIFDGVSGAFNADKILGRKTTMIEKLRTGLAEVVNGLFLGLPNWLSEKAGFKNFSILADSVAESSRKMQESIATSLSEGFTSFTNTISDGFSRFKDKMSELSKWAEDKIAGLGLPSSSKSIAAGKLGADVGSMFANMSNNKSTAADVKGLMSADRLDKLQASLTADPATALAATTVARAGVTVGAAAVEEIKNISKAATENLDDANKKSMTNQDSLFRKLVGKDIAELVKNAMGGAAGAAAELQGDLKKSIDSVSGYLSGIDVGKVAGDLRSGVANMGSNFNHYVAGSGYRGSSGNQTGAGGYTSPGVVGKPESGGLKDSNNRVISTANTDMPAHQRALLDTIAMGDATSGKNYWESPDYNTIVGGKKFDNFGDHPRVFGTPESTAAGRYQFTKTTWDDTVKRYNAKNPNNPITDFSPKNQDRAAYFLAQGDYARRNPGRVLDDDLKSNDPAVGELIKQGLGGQYKNTTWEIFQKKSGAEVGSAYAANLARNRGYEVTPDARQRGGENDRLSNATVAKNSVNPANITMNNQGKIRDLDIKPELKNQLEYAAAQSGVKVEVTSGGQAAIGTGGKRTGSTRHDEGGAADLKLYRIDENGRKQYLDMNNQADAAIMSGFTASAVKAGASGVGAGYMGGQTLHIGGGTTAAWGGAPWVGDSLNKGIRDRNGFNLDKWIEERNKEGRASAVSQNPMTDTEKYKTNPFIANADSAARRNQINAMMGLSKFQTPGIDNLPDPMKTFGDAAGKAITEKLSAPKQPEFVPSITSPLENPRTPTASTVAKNPTGVPADTSAMSAPTAKDIPSIDELSMLLANSTMMA